MDAVVVEEAAAGRDGVEETLSEEGVMDAVEKEAVGKEEEDAAGGEDTVPGR